MANIREWVEKIANKLGVGVEAQAGGGPPTAAEMRQKQGPGFWMGDIGEEPPKAEGKSDGSNRDVPRQKTYR